MIKLKARREALGLSIEKEQTVKSIVYALSVTSILLVFILVPGWVITIKSYVELAAPLSVVGISFLATVLITLSIPVFYLAKPSEQPLTARSGRKQSVHRGVVSRFLVLASFTSFSSALIILLILNVTGL